ncbi:hypothetical protein DY000_02007797 [Brassica cretica]|uniref:Uncharacterized protein n=1 Tax=Brassica cretica TaxID=69181 RepID=A0ABQ7C082_BRACR|nr:hypothetical protein DY000_02007797 [Brassica cretica]
MFGTSIDYELIASIDTRVDMKIEIRMIIVCTLERIRFREQPSFDETTSTSIEKLDTLTIDVDIVDERRTKRRFDHAGSSRAPLPVHDRDPWPREREGDHIETREQFAEPRAAVRHRDCTHRAITEA